MGGLLPARDGVNDLEALLRCALDMLSLALWRVPVIGGKLWQQEATSWRA